MDQCRKPPRLFQIFDSIHGCLHLHWTERPGATVQPIRRTFIMSTVNHRGFRWILFACAVLSLYGCYPKQIGPPGPDGKQLTWPQMNIPQRKAHMKKEILPRAADIFRSWQPQRFASVDCTLCHGAGARTDSFKMPTNHLPRLSGDVRLGPEFAKHPKTTQLKLDRLVPEISTALGLRPFSILTRTGFGCYSCHLGPNGPMYGN